VSTVMEEGVRVIPGLPFCALIESLHFECVL